MLASERGEGAGSKRMIRGEVGSLRSSLLWARRLGLVVCNEASKRIEIVLIFNQIRTYCDRVDNFTDCGFGKLFIMDGLQKKEILLITNETALLNDSRMYKRLVECDHLWIYMHASLSPMYVYSSAHPSYPSTPGRKQLPTWEVERNKTKLTTTKGSGGRNSTRMLKWYRYTSLSILY